MTPTALSTNLTTKIFKVGLKQITKDGMLLVLLPAPFLVGLIFKFGIPTVNAVSEEMLSFSLVQWYGLADGLLACLTPMFTGMVCAFLILEERDEGINAFYRVTPAAGYPYLAARLGIPMVWALFATGLALSIFNISGMRIGAVALCSFISVLTGLATAMMTASLAANRVEGLALSKLMGVGLLGLFAVWLLPAPYHFFGAFLPSFWVGKILADGAGMPAFVFGTLISILWIAIFTGKFYRRVE